MSQYGQYILDEALFQNSQASMWRAHAEAHDTVILKLAMNSDPQNLARLKHEYQLLAKLHIDGIIHPLDEICSDGQYGLVLEDSKQTLLTNILHQHPLPIEKFLPIAIQLARILNELHAAGIIHKDIKPDNILIDLKNNRVTLLDFTVASEISRERQAIETPDHLEGTLAYMSPEQTGRMNRSIDHRTDLYSLGVTFYQMLTGQLPFTALDATSMVHAHMTQEPVPPDKLNPDIPKTLSRIVMVLMAKEVSERYQSAHTLMKDLTHCFEELQAHHAIRSFPIKVQDVPAHLTLPEKLYGREQSVQALLTAYERAASGKIEVMMVTGDPGVGKTAIIEEMHYQLFNHRCFFIHGKFDQYKRDYVLAALAQAFNDFIVQLMMTLKKEQYQAWCTNIREALGQNGKLITDLVPSLVKMIGEQPEVPELDPEKAFNRLMFVLQNFINAIATAEHPLVIFLDDLQWADHITLKWLKEIVTPSFVKIKYLMIIGAYRSREVDSVHDLTHTLKAMKEFQHIHTLPLMPLNQTAVIEWLTDALYAEADRVTPLAALLYQKTEGNPFYLNTLLDSLYRDHFVNFDYQQGEWTWDLSGIERQKITDNVVDFMLKRLQQLPELSQKILEFAACMGIEFSLAELAIIAEQPPDEIAKLLWPALDKGIIIPLSNAYRIVDAQIENTAHTDFGVKYRFAHDRVQQSAYQLLSEEKRSHTHLRIGRLLWEKNDEKSRTENIIDIVSHYNAGLNAITSAHERLRVAELNSQAASRAKFSTNFVEGVRYSDIGLRFLPENSWETHYTLTFDLYKLNAECIYATGNYAKAQQQIEHLLKHAQSSLEKIQIYYLYARLNLAQGKWEEAVTIMITGVALAGIKLPRHPNMIHLLTTVVQFWWHFRKINISNGFVRLQ